MGWLGHLLAESHEIWGIFSRNLQDLKILHWDTAIG